MEKTEFKILVAEDDAMVRDVIVKILSEEKYPVVVADDGLAAIKLLRLEDIKLVLTDLRMPGADGLISSLTPNKPLYLVKKPIL